MLDATCSMLLLPLLPALVTTRGGGVLPRLPLVTEDSVDVMRKSTPLAWRLLAGLGLGLPGLCGRGALWRDASLSEASGVGAS